MSAAPRILLVDDDETFTGVMERALRRRGYEVDIAHDGDSALQSAASRGADFILLDLNLPGPSGLLTLPQLLSTLPGATQSAKE